jgi:hypothetical protein
LRFPKGTLPQAERFWSITAYTPDAIELIANPLNKYLIGDYTPGLQYDKDGSLSIYLSTERPAGVPVANWLPVQKGPFNIMLRVYGVVSGSDVANNTYLPPPVVQSRGGGVGSTGLTIDPNNVRILLYRTYLQTGGYDQIPLPDISLVINGREVALPQCGNRDQVLNADYSKLQDAFANGDDLADIFRLMQKTGAIPDPEIVDGVPVFCAWWFPVDVDTLNIAFPDAAAVYWVMPFLVNVQEEAIIRGTYSDSRYISFALYDSTLDPYTYTLPSGDVIKSFIADYQIDPDAGSQNPWQVQAAPGGHYTVSIKKDITQVEPNVLPFLEDPKLEGFVGSFPMPAPCNTPGSPYACTWGGMFTSPPAAAQSSVFSNPDNTYLPARIPTGPDDRVIVVRGKMPRTPPGTSPVPWPNPNYDIRYWSFCTADYVRPYPTIVEDGCVADKDIVVDENGYFTLVLSTKDARPTNSTTADGVNWLQIRSSVNTLLIVRNMFGDEFPFSTQNVEKNGDWVSAFTSMQEYYPLITADCTTYHYNDNGSWRYCVAPSPLSGPGIGLPGTR